MSTSPIINFGSYDALGYKQDATLTCSVDLQAFSNLDDLKMHDFADKTPYATYEQDFWLLSGNYKFRPTPARVGLMTLSMSDSTGAFSVHPALTAIFTTARNTDGLTLYFDTNTNDYANSITVAFYNASNALIRTDNYSPSSATFSTNQAVTAFKKIIITFNSTNKPYRYLRLLDIDYVNTTYIAGEEIRSAKVVEEIDQTSISMPAGSLEFELFTTNSQFSIIEPAGGYSLLQYLQPLFVYERVDNTVVQIGKFYVTHWENLSEKKIRINAINTVGYLQFLQFWDSQNWYWYSGRIPSVISSIFNGTFSGLDIDYELDSSFTSIMPFEGYVRGDNVRDALQMTALSIGAYVVCDRTGMIKVKPFTLAEDITTSNFTIAKSAKGLQQSLSMKKVVTSVQIKTHNYGLVVTYSPETELYNAYLDIGTHRIVFDALLENEPLFDGAELVGGGYAGDWYDVSVTVAGVVTALGAQRKASLGAYIVSNPDTTIPQNTISINGEAVSNHTGEAVAQRIYDYYQQRYLQKFKIFGATVSAGDSVLIDTLENRQLIGIVEKVEIDLSGGFTSQIEMTGIIVPL